MNSSELAKLLGLRIKGTGKRRVNGVAPYYQAKKGEVTFFSLDYLKRINETESDILIVPESSVSYDKRDIIISASPYKDWLRVVALFRFDFEKPRMHKSFTAFPGVYIGKDVKIGRGTVIYPNAVIMDRTVIGKNVVIGPNTTIGFYGFSYSKENNQYVRNSQSGYVFVSDNVEIGANVCIDRSTAGFTFVGKGTKIDNLVQIGHNVVIGENVVITGQVGIAGSSIIGDNVVIAGQVGIKDNISIGENSIILAKSAVFRSVPPNRTYSGIPARPHKETLRAWARLFL